MKLEISKMLTISVAHICEDTWDKLNKICTEDYTGDAWGLAIYPKSDFGWWIYVPSEESWSGISSEAPEDLMQLLHFAKSVDCGILCLDCDGPEIEGFSTFDWHEAEHLRRLGVKEN